MEQLFLLLGRNYMKAFLMTLVLATSANAFSADNMMAKPSQLDDLIRGEMSAVKTYDSALEKVKDQKELERLKVIREDHVAAVGKLKTFANKDVREDTKTAGAWGAFATAYTGGAKLFGNEAALKALRQGEEHGISEYKEALDDETIKPELKQMIRTQFLPKQEAHIKTLKTFM
jgi:glutaredoxin-related protein